MSRKLDVTRITAIALLIVGITCLHYLTRISEHYYHIFYQQLYFVPIILAGFWFGLRGALLASGSITLLYLPFVIIYWNGFSVDDFNKLMEIVLYNVMAVIVGILKDRESKEQERSLRAEALAAMGRAVSGVAHDMRTPLIAIGGFTSLVRRKLTSLGSNCVDLPAFIRENQQKLAIVIKETARLEKMVNEMLDFSKPLELERSEANILEMIEESIAIVNDISEHHQVKIRNQSSAGLPPVNLDAGRMKQVLINLLINAVQASPVGETVTIASHLKGAHLVISVSDRGPGITPDKRGELFTPFFTTKKDGTGLGLAIVKKIVEAHDGRIEVLDNPEQGLTFRVSLPAGKK